MAYCCGQFQNHTLPSLDAVSKGGCQYNSVGWVMYVSKRDVPLELLLLDLYLPPSSSAWLLSPWKRHSLFSSVSRSSKRLGIFEGHL